MVARGHSYSNDSSQSVFVLSRPRLEKLVEKSMMSDTLRTFVADEAVLIDKKNEKIKTLNTFFLFGLSVSVVEFLILIFRR